MTKNMVREVANTFKCANAADDNYHGTYCEHEFQDKRYGKGVRVFTNLGGGATSGNNKKRCTVCGTMAS
jgi:hypothetical protein